MCVAQVCAACRETSKKNFFFLYSSLSVRQKSGAFFVHIPRFTAKTAQNIPRFSTFSVFRCIFFVVLFAT